MNLHLRAQGERNADDPYSTNPSGFASKQLVDPLSGGLRAGSEDAGDAPVVVDAAAASHVPSDAPTDLVRRDPAAATPPTTVAASEHGLAASGSPVDRLVALVLESGAELFHTHGRRDADAYGWVPVGGNFETLRLQSDEFKHWIRGRARELYGKVPASRTVNEAIAALTGQALFEGAERTIAFRLAEHNGEIWLDLGDAERRAARAAADGWEVVASGDVPVRFVRTHGMQPLPVPVRGGDIDELRSFVNLPDEDHFVLVVSWLLACLRPTGPYPVLVVNGEQGSAKSSLCRILRSLVDPNDAPLRAAPCNNEDLMIAAQTSRMLVYENLSGVSPHLSDALCAISTGGGLGRRAKYTNDGEWLFNAMRPVLMNGIEDLALRADLIDRSIVLVLSPVLDTERTTEAELYAKFALAQPRILGVLLDAVSAALRNQATVALRPLPRMADFAVWVTAAESAFGWEPRTFMRCYERNRADANGIAIESSPIGPALLLVMRAQCTWRGTATELLQELELANERTGTRRPADWPRLPRTLSQLLRRLGPSLRAEGIAVAFTKKPGGNRERQIELAKVGSPRAAEVVRTPALLTMTVCDMGLDTTARNHVGHESRPSERRPPGRADDRDASSLTVAHDSEVEGDEPATLAVGGVA